jgi:hypothetical protein
MLHTRPIWGGTAGRRRPGHVRGNGSVTLKAAVGRGTAGLAVLTDIRVARSTVLIRPMEGPAFGAPIRRPAGERIIIKLLCEK